MMISRRALLQRSGLTVLAALALPGLTRAAERPPMTVWKSPTCGCCGAWVTHLRTAGFTVDAIDVDDLAAVKLRHGIPASLQSCHTALIGGYLVEGHVPAADIVRLLAEKPSIKGLSVPDMPIGSPGMEVPSGEREPYDVLAFRADGTTSVFARH